MCTANGGWLSTLAAMWLISVSPGSALQEQRLASSSRVPGSFSGAGPVETPIETASSRYTGVVVSLEDGELKMVNEAAAAMVRQSLASVKLTVSPTGDKVSIEEWYGREGNNIIQLANAIIYAQIIKASKLSFPSKIKDPKQIFQGIGVIFDLPKELPILPSKTSINCKFGDNGKFYGRCKYFTKGNMRSVLRQHMAHYWTRNATRACKAERESPFEGLTIHLRYGDVKEHNSRLGIFAPCGFFEKVVSDQNFHSVRIITEPDRGHPCISVLTEKFPSALVQSASVAEDACAIMNARHLAVGSPSTFSQTLEVLNTDIKKMFIAVPKDVLKLTESGEFKDDDCTPLEGDMGEKKASYSYWVDGMKNINQISNKANYFGNFPPDKVMLAHVCEEEKEVPFTASLCPAWTRKINDRTDPSNPS